ncbi:MAG: hypothetical protein JSS49_11780 [Planctomycetes bacterium]|nr:hypothetical protein [Planctomycetota bacterium]
MISLCLAGAILVATSVLPTDSSTTALAQNAKGKTSKKSGKAAAVEENTQEELPELSFGYDVRDIDEYVPDPDETPEGKARIGEVSNRAREIYREYNAVEKERRPLAGPRDILLGEIFQLQTVINESTVLIVQNNAQIASLQRMLGLLNGAELANAKNAISNLQANVANLSGIIRGNNTEIANRQPKLNALNIAIRPLDDRLRKLWEELNACRKQWLELRVPQEKYTRSDFEQLKFVIDDWLRIDGLWPDAFCWGALCAYELGDYEKAAELVEKADKIRTQVLRIKKTWSQVEALQGLVCYQLPGQRGKSAGWIQKSMSHGGKEKEADWVTPFIAARAASEHERYASKAKAYYERALKIKPNCLCAKYGLARLQTTSSDKSVSDLTGGTKLLESIWSRTGKRSWRMSFALVQAYDAAKRKGDAERQWDTTLALAPASQHAELNAKRNQ